MAPPLVHVFGALYDSLGARVTSGVLTIRPKTFFTTSGAFISPAPVSITLNPASDIYKDAVLTDLPAGYWRLGDALAATTAADSSGHGHPGTVHGGVTFRQAGALGDGDTAALFNGTSGYLSTAATITTTPSIVAWVKPSAAGFLLRIINCGNNFPFELAIGNDGHLNFFLNFTGLTPGWTDTGAPLPLGVWTHVAMTWNGTTLKAYKNGLQIYSNATWAGRVMLSGTLTIGADSSGTNSWWNGLLDEVALYGYPLSPEQIAYQYALSSAAIGDVAFPLAISNGVPYTVTFDPNPLDTATPLSMKSGYFTTTWVVPTAGSVNLANL
jgi:hypothetical protein